MPEISTVEQPRATPFINVLAWGCDEVQGYLISRPVDAVHFDELLQRSQSSLSLL